MAQRPVSARSLKLGALALLGFGALAVAQVRLAQLMGDEAAALLGRCLECLGGG